MAFCVLTELTCSICGNTKPIEEFQKDRKRSLGYRRRCKTCCNKITAEYRSKSEDHYKSSWIKTVYGLENWFELIRLQNYKCAICGCDLDMSKNTHIDHDHNTGKVRGILCHSCNIGIGFFKDDIERIEKALVYLRKNLENNGNVLVDI